ncbi:MAG: hypothetical protein ACREEM_34580, partial [Blastocatellia bacterium]
IDLPHIRRRSREKVTGKTPVDANGSYRRQLPVVWVLASMIFILLAFVMQAAAQTKPQSQRRPVLIFLDLKETNLEKPSTVAINTLTERLVAAKFRVTTNRREAALVIEGTISSRPSPVTDEVKREGGVNADATASVRLLIGGEVVSTSVERSAPGDWGVQAERVGEDRLIELAGRVAEDLFSSEFVRTISSIPEKDALPVKQSKPARKAARRPGVGIAEIMSLLQDYVPEDRIVGALKKYGIKFKPKDTALQQLRGLGASESLISAVKTSNVVSG